MLKNGYFIGFFRALQYNLNFVQILYVKKKQQRRENDKKNMETNS